MIYSKVTKKNPLEKEFFGIVSEIKRLYPGLIVIEFKNQSETFTMANDLIEFKNSVNIGDSIAKPINNEFIYIYKKKENTFIESRKFIYK